MNCADVGNLIRKLRTDLNMTQKQPADKLGVSDKAISKWERGLGCPDITLVTELSEILSVSLESLLSGSTETSDFKEVNMKRQPVFTPIDISAPDIGGTLSSASHFHLTKSPSGITCIPPSNGALKPFDGIIQTKKRLGYPNRFCLVSTKKHRSESERRLVREMGLEPTRQRHTHLKRACLPIPALSHIFWPV